LAVSLAFGLDKANRLMKVYLRVCLADKNINCLSFSGADFFQIPPHIYTSDSFPSTADHVAVAKMEKDKNSAAIPTATWSMSATSIPMVSMSTGTDPTIRVPILVLFSPKFISLSF